MVKHVGVNQLAQTCAVGPHDVDGPRTAPVTAEGQPLTVGTPDGQTVAGWVVGDTALARAAGIDHINLKVAVILADVGNPAAIGTPVKWVAKPFANTSGISD